MKTVQGDEKELRKFGLMVGGIFGAIGVWPVVIRGQHPRLWAVMLFVALVVPALVRPRYLAQVPRVWLPMATTASGREFRLSHHRGEIVAIVFGYTLCPDVCPMTLARLAKVRTRLGRDANAVRVVFVTLDPMRDTTSRLSAYVRTFDPTFVAL